MVMVVSTAGMIGRGRTGNLGTGVYAPMLYGDANGPLVVAEQERARMEALRKAKKRITTRMYQQRRRAKLVEQGLTTVGRRRQTMEERKGVNK